MANGKENSKEEAKNAQNIEQSTKRTAMSKKEIRQLAEEQARLEQEQNQSLQQSVFNQTQITDQLVDQNKQYGLRNTLAKDSVSLSKKVTKALQESVFAGKDLDDINKSLVKNENLKISLEQNLLNIAKDEGVTVGELLSKKEQLVNLEKEAAIAAAEAADSKQLTQDLERELLDITAEKESLLSQQNQLVDKSKELTEEEFKEAEKRYNKLEEEIKLLEEKELKQQKTLDHSKDILRNSEDLSIEVEKTLTSFEDSITPQERQAMLMAESIQNLETANDKLREQEQIQNNIADAMGISGQALEAINKLTGGALGNVKAIQDKSREQIADLVEQRTKYDELGNVIETGVVSKFEGMGIIFENLGKSLISNLFDPLTLIAAAFSFSKQVTELQRNMALSRQEANDLKFEFSEIAISTGDTAINSERVMKAFGTLQTQLGIPATALKGMAADAAVLQEKIGLSDEAIGGFGIAALQSGKSIEQIKGDVLAATESVRVATGIEISHKEVLEDVGKIHGQIRAQLGGSLEEMAKAVATAKALGMELEQVANVGKSLLDFETSINNELEAELLTGKQLNLERARLLALTGDYENLAKEISKEAGNFTEFSKMNVLQQNAMAKAFGMSADEMADMLMMEEARGKTATELRALGKDELADRVEARDLQDEFNDAVMKLKTIFVDIVGGPVGELLKSLSAIVGTAIKLLSPLFSALTFISKLVSGSKALQVVLLAVIAAFQFKKISGFFKGALDGFKAMKDSIKNVRGGIKGMVDGIKNFGKGSQNIKFDPRMAGGGRFKDVTTGKMVSNKAAEAAGAKKTDLFKGVVKPKDIGKDATAATKDGSKVAQSSKGMSSGLKELAEGLKALGDGKVFKGIAALALAGPAFVVALPSIPFLLFMGLTPLKQLSPNMRALATGLNAMGGGKQFVGIAAIAALGVAGALALLSIPFLGFIALAGIPVATGLTALGGGLTALGTAASTGLPFIAVGLIAALGVALVPFGVALAFAGAGMMMFGKGIQAALEPLPPIIQAVADAISQIMGSLGEFFVTLGEVNFGNMLLALPALTGLGVGLLALGAMALAATPGLLMLHLLGLPVLKEFSNAAENLELASNSIERLAGQVSVMSQIGEGFKEIASGINSMTLSLAMLTPFLPTLAALSAFGLIGETLEKVIGGGEEGGGEGEEEKTTVVSLDEPTMKQLASMVADAVSNVQVNTEVTSDIWGGNNKNGKGTYQGRVKGSTALV